MILIMILGKKDGVAELVVKGWREGSKLVKGWREGSKSVILNFGEN